jgi:spermidine/putrescine ABC transporter ATP-binding subunit
VSERFLRIEGVTKRFGAVEAVHAAEVSIKAGEFFSLLGPSGCGKTTLLRMIAGFVLPDEGAIFIDNVDVTDWPPEKRPTNMVFQSYAIFPHLNVFDNVAFGLRRARLPRAELARRVSEALAMVQLSDFGARRSDQLSGGQRQRVALARALVRRPKVLLLDEPLGALDKRLREAMQVELRQLQREVGITFLFVTHDQEEALSMSDRVAMMSEGRVLQIATPRALYETPNCREVADFIGTMNFFDGSVSRRNGDAADIDAGAIGRIGIDPAPSFAQPGTRVVLALRPEKTLMSATGSIQGRVVTATYLGERTHVLVAVDGLSKPIAVTVQNASSATSTFSPGTLVFLSWEPDAFVVLDR